MTIEVLYFDGCPNGRPTLDRIRHVLQQCGLEYPIIEKRATDANAAQDFRFLGSPTVRINDIDIEPSARSRTDYGLMCRTYSGGGVPSEALIRDAIAESRATRS